VHTETLWKALIEVAWTTSDTKNSINNQLEQKYSGRDLEGMPPPCQTEVGTL